MNVRSAILAVPYLVALWLAHLAGGPAAGQTTGTCPNLADAAIPGQWIGRTRDNVTDCPVPQSGGPQPGSWSVREVFGASAPGELGRYCHYVAGAGANPADLQMPELEKVDADFMAIASLGPTASGDNTPPGESGTGDARLGSILWETLEAHFYEQAGLPGSEECTAAPPAGTGVRLTVVDTAPTATVDPESQPTNSDHGRALLHQGRNLLGEGSACSAELASRLALAYVSYDPQNPELSVTDDEKGGYFGSLTDLAVALEEESRSAPAGTRLVLNLSAGWYAPERAFEDLTPAEQAVYEALEAVRCRGHLVVTAAGNRGCGLSADCAGPLFPAGWEQRPAPDWQRCEELLGGIPGLDPDDMLPAGDGYDPLVFAVGAVEGLGQGVPNARPGAEPPVVAYGSAAVVESYRPGLPTATLTGSSVATLVVAATAARAWSCDPDRSAKEVMALLYASGNDLTREPEFCYQAASPSPCGEGSRPTVRRVSLCPAVAIACGSPVECPRWSPGAPDVSTLDFSAFLANAEPAALSELGEHSPQQGPYACLSEQPGVHTQPGSDPCPSCAILDGGTGYLLVEIDSGFQHTLTDPVLTELCPQGNSYQISGLDPLGAGSTVQVENVGATCSDLELSFTVDGSSTAASAVLIVP